MAEYTSTREGFQRAMKEALAGPPGEEQAFASKMGVPTFYQIFNRKKLQGEAYTSNLGMWRGKITDYDPIVHEFLRDGDMLAARMDGVIKLDGVTTYFESFLFGKVDHESGKLEYLTERSVWGAPGEEPSEGATM